MNHPWFRLSHPENDIYATLRNQSVLGQVLRSLDWITSGSATQMEDEVTARTREAFHPLWYTMKEL